MISNIPIHYESRLDDKIPATFGVAFVSTPSIGSVHMHTHKTHTSGLFVMRMNSTYFTPGSAVLLKCRIISSLESAARAAPVSSKGIFIGFKHSKSDRYFQLILPIFNNFDLEKAII